MALSVVASILVVSAPTFAAEPDVVIAGPTSGGSRVLGDIAVANDMAVAWQQGRHSFVRWSVDGGETFAPRFALRSGLPAKGPRLAACGDTIWASSTWQSQAAVNIGIDWVDATADSVDTGRFSIGRGQSADIACLDNTVGLTWITSSGQVHLAVLDAPCSGSTCVPDYEADLGIAGHIGFPTIAAFDTGFAVTWSFDGITAQSFLVSRPGGALTVAPQPAVPLMTGKDAYSPYVAGDGARVAFTYGRDGQTHMRISDDRGLTFGPRIVVSPFCRDCPEGGSGPDGIDISNGLILVEVSAGGGLCPDPGRCVWEEGFLTRNDGRTWRKTPRHVAGTQLGVLLDNGTAEAWDFHRTDHYTQQVLFNRDPFPWN